MLETLLQILLSIAVKMIIIAAIAIALWQSWLRLRSARQRASKAIARTLNTKTKWWNKPVPLLGAGCIVLLLIVGFAWVSPLTTLYNAAVIVFLIVNYTTIKGVYTATLLYWRRRPRADDLVSKLPPKLGEQIMHVLDARNIVFVKDIPGDLSSLHPREIVGKTFSDNQENVIEKIRDRLLREHRRYHNAFLPPRFTLGLAALITAGCGIGADLLWHDIGYTLAAITLPAGLYLNGNLLGESTSLEEPSGAIPDQHTGVINIFGKRLAFPVYLDEGGHLLPWPLCSIDKIENLRTFEVTIDPAVMQTRQDGNENPVRVFVGEEDDTNPFGLSLSVNQVDPFLAQNVQSREEFIQQLQRAAVTHLFTSISGRTQSELFGNQKSSKAFNNLFSKIEHELEEELDAFAARYGYNILNAKLGRLLLHEDVLSAQELAANAKRLQEEFAGDGGLSKRDALDRAQVQMGKMPRTQNENTFDAGSNLIDLVRELLRGGR